MPADRLAAVGCDTGGSSPVANGQMSTSQNPKQKLLLLLAASAGTHSVGSEAVLTLSSVYKQKKSPRVLKWTICRLPLCEACCGGGNFLYQ